MFILGPSVFHNPPPPSKVQQKMKFHWGTPPLNLKLLGGNSFGAALACFGQLLVCFGWLLVCLWFAIGLSLVCLLFTIGLTLVCFWFTFGLLCFAFGRIPVPQQLQFI